MGDTKYINIVSGKGGTGKTLLCTVLAELLGNQNVRVLVVDMDIFVRGLTALLYFHKGESLKITDENSTTISDIFYRTKPIYNEKIAIDKYRSFYIAPAVQKINELFDIEREMIFDIEHNRNSFEQIMRSIPKEEYDYIFFDCRAGYDSLVSIVHEKSDITICVQEEDDISEVTANNLIRQLERDSSRKSIFKLVNKARNVKSFEELERKQKKGLTFLGYIPFDMDVMNSFGEKSFWEDISKSLYKGAAAEAWNILASKVELRDTLFFKRYSPLLSEKIERPFGYLLLTDRLLSAMGLVLMFLGFSYSFFGDNIRYIFEKRPDQIVSIVISFFGAFVFLYSFSRGRRRWAQA